MPLVRKPVRRRQGLGSLQDRKRLFNEYLAPAFFKRVKLRAHWGKLVSDKHLGGGDMLIEAWASQKRFKRKDDDNGTPPRRNPEVHFKGNERCNVTPICATDADARLVNMSQVKKSRLCREGHVLMKNRNGLIVKRRITQADGTGEREAALVMLQRRGNRNKRATVGADKGYDNKAFINDCRQLKVTPYVAAKDKHSAVDDRVKRHEGHKNSLKVRKRIEEVFGWIKMLGGLASLMGRALQCFAAYNPVRLRAIVGLWNAHHACVLGFVRPKLAEMAVAIAARMRLGNSFFRSKHPAPV